MLDGTYVYVVVDIFEAQKFRWVGGPALTGVQSRRKVPPGFQVVIGQESRDKIRDSVVRISWILDVPSVSLNAQIGSSEVVETVRPLGIAL